MNQRRPKSKDPPPGLPAVAGAKAGGFSGKRPSGVVAPQSKTHQGYFPSSRLAIRPFPGKQHPSDFSDRLCGRRDARRYRKMGATLIALAFPTMRPFRCASGRRARNFFPDVFSKQALRRMRRSEKGACGLLGGGYAFSCCALHQHDACQASNH
jgi:hypothetical protein